MAGCGRPTRGTLLAVVTGGTTPVGYKGALALAGVSVVGGSLIAMERFRTGGGGAMQDAPAADARMGRG